MEYRPFGRTGVKVSPLCLGAMKCGAWGNPDHDDSIKIIHGALDAGINFVDTADVYSRDESEEIVGKALEGRRDHVVLATKFHGSMGDDPNERGNSRRWILQEVENSLRRLRTDWIDLYQVHRADLDTDLDETLGALTDLVRAGKIRQLDISRVPDPAPGGHRGDRRAADDGAAREPARRARRRARRRAPRPDRRDRPARDELQPGGRGLGAAVALAMKSRTRRQASSDAAAKSS